MNYVSTHLMVKIGVGTEPAPVNGILSAFNALWLRTSQHPPCTIQGSPSCSRSSSDTHSVSYPLSNKLLR